jgi:hypothetical protein
MPRSPRSNVFRVALAAGCLAAPAVAETVTVSYSAPAGDRWNYPFNPTPGLRPTASVFGNEAGSPLFDNRDGEMTVYFNTGADVPPGLPAGDYAITAATLTLQFATDLTLAYDTTVDPWQSFLPAGDPNAIADRDEGQPIELFGTAFRDGFSLLTWVETTPFAAPGSNLLSPGVRRAYPIGGNGSGALVDVSNSVRDQFDPIPFAIGAVPGLKPGEFIPIDSPCVFTIAVDEPLVQAYFQQALAAGRVNLSVTSLARVVQQGALFPAFYTKENALVQQGFASAAQLTLTVEIGGCVPADLNCDGSVNASDLSVLLAAWGSNDPAADLSGNGTVGAEDLAILLSAWG